MIAVNPASNSQDPRQLLLERVNGSIAEFTKSASAAKWKTYALRISMVVLGTASTVVLGLQFSDPATQESYEVWSRNVALVLTALVSVLAYLASFWNVEEYWLHHRVKLAQLQHLQSELITASIGESSERPLEEIVGEYRAIVNRTGIWEEALAGHRRNAARDQAAPADGRPPIPGS